MKSYIAIVLLLLLWGAAMSALSLWLDHFPERTRSSELLALVVRAALICIGMAVLAKGRV